MLKDICKNIVVTTVSIPLSLILLCAIGSVCRVTNVSVETVKHNNNK